MSKLSKCQKCSQVEKLYSQISKLTDLNPTNKVNQLFSKLVSLAISDIYEHTLHLQKQTHLQQICSQSEYLLERFWANKIAISSDPPVTLTTFPYYQNYLDLVQLEFFSLKGCTQHQIHHFLFVGGGPLPLTAIILAKEYGVSVTVLDYDHDACLASKLLISKLGLQNQINIINQDGSSYLDYGKYDVISVAALAGTDDTVKKNILLQIKSNAKPKTHILARSAWGNRQLLYKSIDRQLYEIFTPIIEVHPQNHVVNSVIIMST